MSSRQGERDTTMAQNKAADKRERSYTNLLEIQIPPTPNPDTGLLYHYSQSKTQEIFIILEKFWLQDPKCDREFPFMSVK